ncbi:MAG TPA: hypothetical protein VLM79_28510, partial [Kofleriaceae bacterium]|nr:hypothetical protein [Kofleriaceae bacterium]
DWQLRRRRETAPSPNEVADLDLAERTLDPTRFPEDVRAVVRELIAGHDGLEEAWRVYHRRLGAIETKDGSSARRSTRRLVETNLERLRDHGGFTRDTRGEEATYQPTYRYQAQVRELAANEALRRVRDVLVRDH